MATTTIVAKIHFEDFSGNQFERLTFGYASRLRSWDGGINWLGETGKDAGRDVWGTHASETYCYQCANYKSMTNRKAKDDIDKLVAGGTIPDHLIVVCGGTVPTGVRDTIIKYANGKGIKKAAVWSGADFEEMLRNETPELIRRFVDGEEFPDTPKDLIAFAKKVSIKNDQDIVDAILENINRPAFTTRLRGESSLPNFEKALEDTIGLLNTGVHQLRDGTVINRLPSRHRISDAVLKKEMEELTKLVIHLRDRFSQLKREKEITDCGCGDADCAVFMVSDKAAIEIDDLKQKIFAQVKKIEPKYNLSFS